jgi:hypothetical protein
VVKKCDNVRIKTVARKKERSKKKLNLAMFSKFVFNGMLNSVIDFEFSGYLFSSGKAPIYYLLLK